MTEQTQTAAKKPRTGKKQLGDALIDKGIITRDQLMIALREQESMGLRIGAVLIQLGFVTDSIIRDALSENTGFSTVDLTGAVIGAEALKMVPQDMARRYKILPLSYSAHLNELSVAMPDTYNIVALDQIRALHDNTLKITPVLGSEIDITTIIEEVYGFDLSIDGILQEIETGEVDLDSLQTEGDQYSHPMVRLINALLADAVQQGASDIHFEPEEAFLRIRYRIDGVLRQVRSIHKSYWPAMVVRLKVISNMNIAESRAPQDGRISLTLIGRKIDFRVAAQPTSYGENVVLRILDRRTGIVPLDSLGLSEENLYAIKMMLAKPEGVILVTGPTGSGKTTTLYSVLSHINTEAINIMTMEDPVEYPMPMIRQTSINSAAKMGFAEGIRSMMRQDPDVILVGEIRDDITAEMAFRAAMTGHQVFSTLHTNSAVGSVPRLSDLGVLPDILSANLIGIIAQRLLRKLCIKCKESHDVDELEGKLLGISDTDKAPQIYRAVGCPDCDHVGYKGRTAIVEILQIGDDLQRLISEGTPAHALQKAAAQGGFRTLADDACRRVLDGTTSLEEITRVVDLTDRIGV
ncbi:MAG: secretion system protein E [SAR86 cluster bacterium]|uniref:Secretion system protein E n=1 Tax=SAR86 cluster bacterium TaxID=2030880 RepID=A0A2A5B4H9_9GAMM|nr:MAG: secretion system protein E [SAR86 cluster bacterium]